MSAAANPTKERATNIAMGLRRGLRWEVRPLNQVLNVKDASVDTVTFGDQRVDFLDHEQEALGSLRSIVESLVGFGKSIVGDGFEYVVVPDVNQVRPLLSILGEERELSRRTARCI